MEKKIQNTIHSIIKTDFWSLDSKHQAFDPPVTEPPGIWTCKTSFVRGEPQSTIVCHSNYLLTEHKIFRTTSSPHRCPERLMSKAY